MNKFFSYVLCFAVVWQTFCLTAAADNTQVSGTRDLPDQTVAPDSSYNTTVSVNVDENNKPNAFIVTEVLPIGWTPSNEVPPRSSFDSNTGELKWLFGVSLPVEDVQISYDTAVPQSAPSQGYSISGTLKYNDPNGDPITNSIGGEDSITVAVQPETVSKPGIPSGPSPVCVNTSQQYNSSGATSSLSHVIEYSFAWGDSSSSPWSTNKFATHLWDSPGTYQITVTARCQQHANITNTSSIKQVEVTPCDGCAGGTKQRAYYPFDEGSGAVGHDIWNGFDGRLLNASWGSSAQSAQGDSCVIFSATGNSVRLPKGILNKMPRGTFMCWIYPTARGDRNSYIVSKQVAGVIALFDIWVNSSGKIDINIGGADSYSQSNGLIPLNEWTHIAVTWDGSQKKVYINGSLDSTGGTANVGNNKQKTYLGRAVTDSSDRFMGRIDEVRIWKRALSASDIICYASK